MWVWVGQKKITVVLLGEKFYSSVVDVSVLDLTSKIITTLVFRKKLDLLVLYFWVQIKMIYPKLWNEPKNWLLAHSHLSPFSLSFSLHFVLEEFTILSILPCLL